MKARLSSSVLTSGEPMRSASCQWGYCSNRAETHLGANAQHRLTIGSEPLLPEITVAVDNRVETKRRLL